jgi:hypothetical protein
MEGALHFKKETKKVKKGEKKKGKATISKYKDYTADIYKSKI